MTKPLDILLLSPWLPWPPHDGARIRIFETLRFLSQQHRVVLVAPTYSPAELDQVAALAEVGASVHTVAVPDGSLARLRRLTGGIAAGAPPIQAFYRNRAVAERIRQLTSEIDFDIVQVEFSFLAHYLRSVHGNRRPKTILTMHNVESMRYDRELEFTPWNARRLVVIADRYLFPRWEQRAVRSFDGVIAVSAADAAWVTRCAPHTALRIAPNGVDVEFFRPQSGIRNAQTVVFTGAMDYPPNIDAVLWFAEEMLPLLHARLPRLQFIVVGRKPPANVRALATRPNVQITGEVPDIRPYLAEALAMVVPLRSGGGTRLKILQAMAMARPVVSTTLGAEGLSVANNEHILIADSPDQFANAVVALAGSPDLARRLAETGRKLALADYDWRKCLLGLQDLYQAVLAGGPP